MKAKEGETMSLEAMKQITAAEQAAKERRAAAEAEARRLTARGGKSRSGFAAKDPRRCGGTGQGGTCGGRGTGGSPGRRDRAGGGAGERTAAQTGGGAYGRCRRVDRRKGSETLRWPLLK